jgi:hypothetical protein
VARFDSNGAFRWSRTLNGSANGFDGADSVAVERGGYIIAAGTLDNAGTGTGEDFTVARFAPNGALLWQRNLNGSAGASDRARSVVIDRQGNAVAAGRLDNGGAVAGGDFAVVKFAPNGAVLWRRALNGSADGLDEAWSVAVDRNGDVVAAGWRFEFATVLDILVAKFQGDSGTLRWQQTLNGTANDVDVPFSVAVDSQQNVVVAGFTSNTGTGEDFTVAKFHRNTGALLWQQDLNGSANGHDGAIGLAADVEGGIFAAGFTFNTGTGDDFTVAKFDR